MDVLFLQGAEMWWTHNATKWWTSWGVVQLPYSHLLPQDPSDAILTVRPAVDVWCTRCVDASVQQNLGVLNFGD
jgi:hypothetical protein